MREGGRKGERKNKEENERKKEEMERVFNKVEDNAAVRKRAETTQQERGDSLAEGCFTFGKVDLAPTIEEYTALLHCPKIQVDRIYSRAANVPAFLKRLMNITGMSEQWKVDVFALSIYGLVIFSKALGHVDEAVSDLFDRLNKWAIFVPTILAETFRSLNACRRAGEGRFIGCAQLLLSWFQSHFWKVKRVSYRIFSENYSPLKELVAMPRRDNITEENWMTVLQNLQEEDVEWRAPWMVPLLGIWGAVGYVPLLALRQYRSRQFTPPTHRLAQCEFIYMGNNYKNKVCEISNAWNQTRRMKRFAANPMTTLEYDWWRDQRINENIPMSDQENTRSIEEHLTVIPFELEIIRQDFERKSLELEKRIEQLEEEKMQLASQSRIEELKEKIEELKVVLQNRELQIELLEVNNERWKEQLHQSQDQVRNRDYVMGEALTQVREVADHLQTLEVQVDVLSLKYESESDQGRELAWLLRQVKALSIKAKPYM
ncbi:uncharacterized protein [Gossypium hirsutum]|uniref:DUF7745 domain-containing protein n=1 Tax=Gossypium hirsutum TaxID=3635 RepID=A0A1U8P1T4_GOSHI|nr:uncharacterized protein LOC107954109 [Gossypium hirsutum]